MANTAHDAIDVNNLQLAEAHLAPQMTGSKGKQGGKCRAGGDAGWPGDTVPRAR